MNIRMPGVAIYEQEKDVKYRLWLERFGGHQYTHFTLCEAGTTKMLFFDIESFLLAIELTRLLQSEKSLYKQPSLTVHETQEIGTYFLWVDGETFVLCKEEETEMMIFDIDAFLLAIELSRLMQTEEGD